MQRKSVSVIHHAVRWRPRDKCTPRRRPRPHCSFRSYRLASLLQSAAHGYDYYYYCYCGRRGTRIYTVYTLQYVYRFEVACRVVRAVEYFMRLIPGPHLSKIPHHLAPIRRAQPLREIRNDRTVCFGSDAARLLMWLVLLFFLIMRLIDATVVRWWRWRRRRRRRRSRSCETSTIFNKRTIKKKTPTTQNEYVHKR